MVLVLSMALNTRWSRLILRIGAALGPGGGGETRPRVAITALTGRTPRPRPVPGVDRWLRVLVLCVRVVPNLYLACGSRESPRRRVGKTRVAECASALPPWLFLLRIPPASGRCHEFHSGVEDRSGDFQETIIVRINCGPPEKRCHEVLEERLVVTHKGAEISQQAPGLPTPQPGRPSCLGHGTDGMLVAALSSTALTVSPEPP